jgi:hypothetical protein
MGTNEAAVVPFIVEAAATAKINPMRGFARGFFAKLVPNTRKLGLLDANHGYLREKWGQAGLLEFEFADDTASDYASYDAVAEDRAASAGAGAGTDTDAGDGDGDGDSDSDVDTGAGSGTGTGTE